MDEIYKEIKAKLNELRLARVDPEILEFLAHLMEEIVNSNMFLEFDKFELGEILSYQEIIGIDTPQKAVMCAIRIAMDGEKEINEIAEKYTDLLDRTLQKEVVGVKLNPDGTWVAIIKDDYDPILD